jgi:hypothetical protein
VRPDEVVEALTFALDRLADADWTVSGADRAEVELLDTLVVASHRLAGMVAVQARRVEVSGAVERVEGTGVACHLTRVHRLTRAQAQRVALAHKDLDAWPEVARAAITGHVNPFQAQVMGRELDGVGPRLCREDADRVAATLVAYAGEFDSMRLRVLARRVVDHVAPEVGEDRDRAQVDAEYERAVRDRYLRFADEGDGAVRFDGLLPADQGLAFKALIDAHAQRLRADRAGALDEAGLAGRPGTGGTWEGQAGGGLARGTVGTAVPAPAQRRADALAQIGVDAQNNPDCPTLGGDRPRITVTVPLDRLTQGLGEMAQTSAGTLLPVAVIRRLACDADILPVVLGSAGQVLDVGRAQRLVTPSIRRALELRDGGCVFPGCDRSAYVCHAHHLRPWWAGGHTSIDNLVLVCDYHHAVVEPARLACSNEPWDPRDPERWRIELDADGIPTAIPPIRLDLGQAPIYHQRHKLTCSKLPRPFGSPPLRPGRPPGPGRPPSPPDSPSSARPPDIVTSPGREASGSTVTPASSAAARGTGSSPPVKGAAVALVPCAPLWPPRVSAPWDGIGAGPRAPEDRQGAECSGEQVKSALGQ